MNISIYTIIEWAGWEFPKNWRETHNLEMYQPEILGFNDCVMSTCRVYDKYVNKYIESMGKSTMIRVFAHMADRGDSKVLKAAHEYAKKKSIEMFLFNINDQLKKEG